MKLSETIKNRRSVFPNQFTGQTVSKEQIIELLEAANWAPSHRQTNPWRFKVFQDESLGLFAEKMSAAYTRTTPEKAYSAFKLKKSVEKVMSSGAVIAICMQRDLKDRVPEWEEIAATAMAVQNMWLMTGQLGLGGYWSSPGYISDMKEELQLAEGERCLGFFYLGAYDAPMPDGDREPVEEKITWF
ncbi:nitroreductase family protein [Leeuwenhoekiella sp. H156]|uniref:nitroreductase family protein n=1 Tax=Leeuwenhoekiella sp. H156 TaxID=3450128 RepID=UPI003FA40F80